VKTRPVLLSLVAGLFLSATAAAEPKDKPNDATREKAAALFKEADANYKIKEYEKALAGFKEAYMLAHEPVLLFNIAQCHRQMDQLDEALKSYQAFLRDDPKSELRANAESRITEIKAELKRRSLKGAVEITTKQDPAEVFLDGEAKGQSPVKLSEIAPGPHLLTIKKPGFVDYELSIKVEPARTLTLAVPQLTVIPEAEVKVVKVEGGLSRRKALFLASGLSGGLGLLAGGGALALALPAKSQQDDETPVDDLEEKADGIRTRRDNALLLSHISTGLLAGAALSGVIALASKRGDQRPSAVLLPAPGGAALIVRY
jgi:tetratricopeptide (TPR) repeat protein